MAQQYPLLSDRAALAEADELMTRFGELAWLEAATRADRSRSIGNLAHFCRWRSIEHAIKVLSDERAPGAIH